MKIELRPGLSTHLHSDQSRVQRLQARLKNLQRFSDPAENVTPRLSAAQAVGPILSLLIIGVWLVGLSGGFYTPLTILTVVGFVLSILGLFIPPLGLLGIGMLATLDAATRNFLLTGGLLRWNTLNYWLLLVIVLNLLFILRLKDVHSRLLQLFLALLAIELLISKSVTSGLLDILNIGTAFGLLVYFARAYQSKGGLYWMGVVSGLVSAMGGFVYYSQIDRLPYVNPNSWAFFPLTGIFAACLAFSSSKDHRMGNFILLFLSAVNLIWIFLSASRGSMIVGVLCLVFLFLWTRKLTWKVIFVGLVYLVIGYISLMFAEQQAYATRRLDKLFNPQYSLEERTSGRSNIAQAGLRIFSQNPLGVGTGNFREAIASSGLSFNEVAAHSGWIKVLAENGLPGILLLTFYILSFSIVGLKSRNRDRIFLGLLVTSSFALALLSKEFQGKGLWFFASGATVLLHPYEISENLARKSRAALDKILAKNRNHHSTENG